MQGPISFGVAVDPGLTLIEDSLPTADGGIQQDFVQATFYTSGRVISLQLYQIANDNAGNCELRGTAVPAT
jgi:hypothetical protein